MGEKQKGLVTSPPIPPPSPPSSSFPVTPHASRLRSHFGSNPASLAEDFLGRVWIRLEWFWDFHLLRPRAPPSDTCWPPPRASFTTAQAKDSPVVTCASSTSTNDISTSSPWVCTLFTTPKLFSFGPTFRNTSDHSPCPRPCPPPGFRCPGVEIRIQRVEPTRKIDLFYLFDPEMALVNGV